eukprot:7071897-Pyramimonas_sp.AAC.1
MGATAWERFGAPGSFETAWERLGACRERLRAPGSVPACRSGAIPLAPARSERRIWLARPSGARARLRRARLHRSA